ncbi:MAG: GTP-binding protein [Promethearchaeota archaeon]
MEKIRLQVKQAKRRDIGRSILRIDEEIMKELNIKTGNIIEVIGKKRSAGIAWPSYPQDKGLRIVRMESRLQKNTGTIINDMIEIDKVTPQHAQKVTLAPVLEKIRKIPRFERFVKRKLNNYPITIDDYLFMPLGVNTEVTFKVISLIPNAVCLIKRETELNIIEKITEFNFLSINQLKNLEKFLKKCEYSKKELLAEVEQELIEKKDLVRDSEVKIKHVIEYLLQENDLHWLISKIAYDLHNKYEKTISQGQAEAILKRVLDIKLSSAGRTQLYELRKKIRRYENFLAHFSDLAKIYDFALKVVILGLRSEQATKLLSMPPTPRPSGTRITVGVDFYLKPIEITDTRLKLHLWDVSVEHRYKFLIPRYCKGAHGAIIVYDQSDKDSFKLVKEFYKDLKEGTNLKFELSERRGTYADMPIILIGISNGKDVTSEEGQSLANELGTYGYIEISETDTENFENILTSLSLGIISNYQNALKKSPSPKFNFKISVVGDINVGKTSLIEKFTQGSFKRDYIETKGTQFSVYDEKIDGDQIRSLFWDISGQDTYHFLRERFFKDSIAAIVVCSLEDNISGIESFEHISDWNEDIRNYCGNIPVVLFVNKVDLVDEDDIDHSTIQDIVKQNDFIGYHITSAKTGEGVKKAFNKIIEKLYNSYNIS